MVDLALDEHERDLLGGAGGEAAATAMRIITALARMVGADSLVPVVSAHIDGCLFHGDAGLDFAERLAAEGARVAVPTTLNVSSLDLIHPDRYRGDEETKAKARRLMDAYVAMGCRPTWTCAPYQLSQRPAFGDHIAWAESNAIVFANSVLGARTDRYGDFTDICAALTGRVPDAGLHRSEARRGEIIIDVTDLPASLLEQRIMYPLLGHVIGGYVASSVPVIVGLPGTASEDDLKALGAATASSGSVALFHAVGVTPEAPTLDAALQGRPATATITVTPAVLRQAREDLSTGPSRGLTAVSVGTPHLSVAEFARLTDLVGDQRFAVPFYVNTGRGVLAEVKRRGWLDGLERAGARIVVDTCTYITPIIDAPGVVMTDSAKWAYYAPGNIGVEVIFATLEECVRSAASGRVWRDDNLWDLA